VIRIDEPAPGIGVTTLSWVGSDLFLAVTYSDHVIRIYNASNGELFVFLLLLKLEILD
jgi:hypothetical protein